MTKLLKTTLLTAIAATLFVTAQPQTADAGICFSNSFSAASHSFRNAANASSAKARAAISALARRGLRPSRIHPPRCNSHSGRTTCTTTIVMCSR